MAISRGVVLLAFAESLAAIESAWMLREAGYTVHAVTRRGSRPALVHSKGIQVHEVTSPAQRCDDTVAEVVALARTLSAQVALPLDDDAIWVFDQASDRLAPTAVAGPTGRLAGLALDKRQQLDGARAAGLRVPATTVLAPGGASEVPPPPSPLGWVVKPALAVSRRGAGLGRGDVSIASTGADLARILADVSAPMLLQPRLAGGGAGVFGYVDDGEVRAMSGHRRVRMMNPSGSGSSACRSARPSTELAAAVSRFVTASGWRGMFMVELLEPDDGSAPVFMELNGRAWGSMALARHRRLPYPVWAVQDALSGESGAPVAIEDDTGQEPVVRHLGRELVHLAFVLRGPQHGTDVTWPGRWRTVLTVLRWRREDVPYNYRPGEGRTLLADTWKTVRSQLARGISRVRT